MWALLEFPQLVDSQVVEATKFNPKGVLPHRGEGRSTHLLYYLGEVGNVPQWLLFSFKQPLFHVLRHVCQGSEYNLSPSLGREILPLIVQEPVHKVSCISSPS